MNQLVLIALRKPYTFVVLAILILGYGGLIALEMPLDVFPTINIPVIASVWDYFGLLPEEVSGRITFIYERALTSTVEGMRRIVSQSYYGMSITNVFLEEGANLAAVEAEITAMAAKVVKWLPPDISSAMIMRLNASQVPVATLKVTSDTLTQGELYNLAFFRIRSLILTVPGTIVPHPYGGKPLMLLVSIDPQKLLSRHVTLKDVHDIFMKQALVLPAGDQKIKAVDWLVQSNVQPLSIEEFNDIPIKGIGNSYVYLRDVADVRIAGPPQINAVYMEGQQAVLIVVMKESIASTLDVVDGIKKIIPRINEVVPKGVDISLINDASTFVKDALADVIHEMLTATALVSLIVMLLLGSWRATVIVVITIPLSILSAIMGLHVIGGSLNIMTLGGLALSVGILVDNAIVMIENIDTHLAMGKPLETAIIDAANQIIIPTFVATLCISVVWLPLFRLEGVSSYLFVPMAWAIIFAMVASFILSRTLLATMAKYMLAGHHAPPDQPHRHPPRRWAVFIRFQQDFARRFGQFRDRYTVRLEQAIVHRGAFVGISLALVLVSLGLYYFEGREFFPEIKSGVMQMHMRAPLGTRIEATGRITSLVSNDIKRMLPGQVESIVSNCGLPVGPHNLAFIPTPTVGVQDCDLTITLTNEKSPVWEYRRIIRKGLNERYPGTAFTFQPADLTAKILNFGSWAPIDVQVIGPDIRENYEFARKLRAALSQIPGASDVVIQQPMRQPTILVNHDRALGLNMGLTQEEITTNLLYSTSGSQQVDQKYWLDRKTGIVYQINVYTPQPHLTSVNDLVTIPSQKGSDDLSYPEDLLENKEGSYHPEPPRLLGNVTTQTPVGSPSQITHVDIMPVFDILVSPEGRDLGSVLEDVEKVAKNMEHELPRGAVIEFRGIAETMRHTFAEMLFGLILATIVVYFLIVVNFQSWLDPFIIITALPGAVAGIAWSLLLTHTYISVPVLTGAIMTMGVATANSILVVSHARERFAVHGDALRAAIEAGQARFRAVLMTASAMILGMLPMAMGNSQNAPLGRAAMGGLTAATVFTLFFVPCVYAIIYNRQTARQKAGAQDGNPS